MLYLIASYIVGTILFAALVGKLKGVNLQAENSGNLGARNAGRTLGKGAFIAVAVGDGLKGVFIVIAGRLLDYSDVFIAAAVIAVVVGHLYPFWNKGQGGKGVATIIGALLAFSPLYFTVFLASFLFSLAVVRSATLSMVIGFVMYGVVLIVMQWQAGIIFSVALLLVIAKQRKSIMERVRPNVLE